MFIRTRDILEMAQVFYPVIIILGCALQLLVLVIRRKDINRLLADVQRFVNLRNILAYFSRGNFYVCLFTENANNERRNIYKNTEAKVTLYCKVYEIAMFVSYAFFAGVPGILDFLAYLSGTRIVVHPDVGLFHDLWLIIIRFENYRYF